MAALPAAPASDAEEIDRRIAVLLEAGRGLEADWRETLLRTMIGDGLDQLPLPGRGATLTRWRALEAVARHDLSLVKLYESHVDALAILAEIDRASPRAGALYAVWASEARHLPITIRADTTIRDASRVVIDGRKAWCSGAESVDVGLMTATDGSGGRFLVEVPMSADGITIDSSDWNAVGMRESRSATVVCEAVPARIVGSAGSYLERPGFWHGGAGVAACWYGAAAAVGTRVRDLQAGRDDVHALAHLGAIDAILAAGAALLRETAASIDARPAGDAARIALRARGAMADLAESVLHHAEHAIGPGPLCNEPGLARRVADLPIFVRQSRAEHDRVAQSRALLSDSSEMHGTGWSL